MAFNLDLVNPGEEMPRRRVLEDGTYIIGRGKAAKIVLPYPEISERHALLVLRGEKAQLEDMHSANGTYVNGMPIQDLVELNGDAVVQIGDCMGLPAELVHKTPSDGLSGQDDEQKLGFTYAALDHYVLTGECEDQATREKIDRMHRINLHKLEPMPAFIPGEDARA